MDSKRDLKHKKKNKLLKKQRKKNRKNLKKSKAKMILYIFTFLSICILLLILFYIIFRIIFNKKTITIQYPQDDLTLVSAYFRIKSKSKYSEYLNWISNIVLLNKSFVFYTNKEFMPILKEMRPKELHYKTVFIELEMEEFYSYKNYYNEFNKSFYIDNENSYHTVPLYIVWAEKCKFLEKAIINNYFNSKCFYWIDAGIFHEPRSEMQKYINTWPTTKKCFEDPRLVMGQVKYYSDKEKQRIINLDRNAILNLINNYNVDASMFGGQPINAMKFINYYYDALRLFIKNNLFIGKDQNIFTFVAFSHNLILCKNYFESKNYLA